MITNTSPSTKQWNDAVNAVNIYTNTQYGKIQDVLTKVETRVKEVRAASRQLDILTEKLRENTAFLTYLVRNY